MTSIKVNVMTNANVLVGEFEFEVSTNVSEIKSNLRDAYGAGILASGKYVVTNQVIAPGDYIYKITGER
jgi:hypothetical protein